MALSPLRRYQPAGDYAIPSITPPGDQLPGILLPPDFSTAQQDFAPTPPPQPDPDNIPAPDKTGINGPQKQAANMPPPTANPNAPMPGAKALGAPPPPKPPSTPSTPPPAPSAGISISEPPDQGDYNYQPYSGSFAGGPPAPATGSPIERRMALQPPPPPPKPNWMQRLAAAAMGGAAGYVNAARRSYIPPEETAQAEQNVLAPGYARQKALYDQQKADLDDKVNLQMKQEQMEGLKEQREAQAAYRRAQAIAQQDIEDRKQQEADDRAQAVRDHIKQQQSETNRKFLDFQMKGREADSVYQAETDPRPPNYQFVPDPEKPGYGFAAPPAWQPAPETLLPFLPGVKAGDMISHSQYKQASDGLMKVKQQQEKPTPNANEWQMYLDAAGGDPAKALAKMNADKIAVAQQSRPERQPSQAELDRQHKSEVNQLAQQALDEVHGAAPNDPARIDNAIANVSDYGNYQNHPIGDSRQEVLNVLNQWKVQGVKPSQAATNLKAAQNRLNKGSALDRLGQLAGKPAQGSPATPPAPPKPAPSPTPKAAAPTPSSAPKPNINVGDVKYLKGQKVKITQVYPDGSADYESVSQ